MRYLGLSLLMAAAAVPALPAAAQSAQPSQAAQQQSQTSSNERRICRSNQDNTGSILGGRRVCRTAAQWRQMEEDARSSLERSRNNPLPGGQ